MTPLPVDGGEGSLGQSARHVLCQVSVLLDSARHTWISLISAG